MILDWIDSAVETFAADRTGKVDYAVHSSGARIVGIGNARMTSSTYLNPNSTLSRRAARALGLSTHHGPEEVIKPSIGIGRYEGLLLFCVCFAFFSSVRGVALSRLLLHHFDFFFFSFFLFFFFSFLFSCWPFGGSQGRVSVQLAPFGRVVPTSVSIEHVPPSIAHSVQSAPQALQIWGYRSVTDTTAIQLDNGDCAFDVTLPQSVQYCNLKTDLRHPVNIVQLRIMSNHGKLEYTCLYRFRVHGGLA
jgi:SUN domain-containing protein 1/2